jgi:hypothetical protein
VQEDMNSFLINLINNTQDVQYALIDSVKNQCGAE